MVTAKTHSPFRKRVFAHVTSKNKHNLNPDKITEDLYCLAFNFPTSKLIM